MAKNYNKDFVPGTPKLEVYYRKTEKNYKGCILSVPGICHGAWCFKNFLNFMPDNGYDFYSVSLRGHADSDGHENLNKYGLSDYSKDIKRCIEYCKSNECKYKMKSEPFLLGHSMGGAVVQKYIGEYFDTVKGAILFASATAGGMNLGQTLKDCIIRKNLRLASYVGYGLGKRMQIDSIYKSAFFDKRISKENAKFYKEKLCKESLIILFHDLYKEYTNNYNIDIPILVVGSYADSYFPEESLRKTADTYNCSENNTKKQLKILPELCHDMMLDPDWEKSAKIVLEFMENNK